MNTSYVGALCGQKTSLVTPPAPPDQDVHYLDPSLVARKRCYNPSCSHLFFLLWSLLIFSFASFSPCVRTRLSKYVSTFLSCPVTKFFFFPRWLTSPFLLAWELPDVPSPRGGPRRLMRQKGDGRQQCRGGSDRLLMCWVKPGRATRA